LIRKLPLPVQQSLATHILDIYISTDTSRPVSPITILTEATMFFFAASVSLLPLFSLLVSAKPVAQETRTVDLPPIIGDIPAGLIPTDIIFPIIPTRTVIEGRAPTDSFVIAPTRTVIGGTTAKPTTIKTSTSARPTTTATWQRCGGFVVTPVPCPTGQICVDNPYQPGCGMACDMPGICVKPTVCGGFAGLKCPTGKKCFDDPRDRCDPEAGGADCIGICI
jgi:hypothetical protein